MCEPENLHLQIMLGIVYYMLRQQELGTHHHGGQTELMAKLTELGERWLLDSTSSLS